MVAFLTSKYDFPVNCGLCMYFVIFRSVRFEVTTRLSFDLHILSRPQSFCYFLHTFVQMFCIVC